MCPWADVLYALDVDWWKKYGREARELFQGALVTPQSVRGAHRELAWLGHEKTNSGAAALAQAAYWRADRIVLLGYDCQHTGGRRHWHDDHPGTLGNADGVASWPAHFAAVMPRLRGVEVINATRETALGLFPRQTLEAALGVAKTGADALDRDVQMEDARLPRDLHVGAREHAPAHGPEALLEAAPVHLHHG